MKERPVLKWIRAEDPEKSLDDAGIAALSAAGWIPVFGPISDLGNEATGPKHAVMLVMFPPASRSGPQVLWAGLLAGVIGGGIIATALLASVAVAF